jgi:hypothetical protein|nr:MAG TPA: hypothetical protein [Caudoviricetes sp.]
MTKNRLIDAVLNSDGPQPLKDVALNCAEGLPYGAREDVPKDVLLHEFTSELQEALTHETGFTTSEYLQYIEAVTGGLQA